MQELITRLTEKAGISTDQATKSIETIKEFVKEKFPMLGGAVDNMFATSAENVADKAEDLFDSAKDKLGDMFGGDKK